MTIENFIRDALYKPNDYISYHVGRELAELHPGKTILDVRSFKAEYCLWPRWPNGCPPEVEDRWMK